MSVFNTIIDNTELSNQLEPISINIESTSNNISHSINTINTSYMFSDNSVNDLSELDENQLLTKLRCVVSCPNLPKLKQPDYILLPPKVISLFLKRYVSIDLLNKVDSDIETAIEKCLYFCSLLRSPYTPDEDGIWKSWHSKYLDSIYQHKYTQVLEVLYKGSKSKGAIVDCDFESIVGEKTYSYRLKETYAKCKCVNYTAKSKWLKTLLMNDYIQSIEIAEHNPICKNLLNIYPMITLPTHKEIIAEAKRMIKYNKLTKKGNKLVYLNKKSITPYLDTKGNVQKGIAIVEKHIELFELLTNDGWLIPSPSCNAGGRVCDSFTLMPSWIRSLVKINGSPMCESDYKCLHPNIAMCIYGGNEQYLTHQKVADETNIELLKVKVAHLSFFNRSEYTPKMYDSMRKSVLWNYYNDKHPEMINNIITEKKNKNYKETSKRMFKKEVDIMTDVIIKLNAIGILVLYVYDSLLCDPCHLNIVIKLMNEVILNHGVFTLVG